MKKGSEPEVAPPVDLDALTAPDKVTLEISCEGFSLAAFDGFSNLIARRDYVMETPCRSVGTAAGDIIDDMGATFSCERQGTWDEFHETEIGKLATAMDDALFSGAFDIALALIKVAQTWGTVRSPKWKEATDG